VADTRNPDGPYGGPILKGGSRRNFTITGQCGIPTIARAVAFTFTVIGPVATGHLTVWPVRAPFPPVPTLEYLTGETATTRATVLLSRTGAIAVQTLSTTHLVVDVNGYFTAAEASNTPQGFNALLNNTTGTNNTAIGFQALQSNTFGEDNTATGAFALVNNTTGGGNTAVGFLAGGGVTTGSNNIHIGNVGTAADSNVIRIGLAGTHAGTFIAGIRDVVITGDWAGYGMGGD
jgi:hypothetical protein